MISATAHMKIEKIPIWQLQVVEHDLPWTCYIDKFHNYLELLQMNPELDVDPIIVKPSSEFPGMYAIYNGKHRYCASIMASRNYIWCIIVEEEQNERNTVPQR